MNMRRPLVLFANLLLKSAALTLLIFSVAPVSAAETFPDKPVSLMVPYPAGGLSDVIARFVNMPLSKQLGQPVIVENLGGNLKDIFHLIPAATDEYLASRKCHKSLLSFNSRGRSLR
jgi:hypothetical protein